MNDFAGKFLIRKCTMENGKKAVIICGVALPMDGNLDSVSDMDEFWLAGLSVTEAEKYLPVNKQGFQGSPEDFLARIPSTDNGEWILKNKDEK